MARHESKAPGFARQYSFKDAADRGLDPSICKHHAPSTDSLKSDKSQVDHPEWSAVVDGDDDHDCDDLREGEVIDLPAGSFEYDGANESAVQRQPRLPPTPGASPQPSIPARSPRPRGRSMVDELAKAASQHATQPADLPYRSRRTPQQPPALSTSLPETMDSPSFDLPSPAWTAVGSPALYAQPDSPVLGGSDLSRSGSFSMARPDSPRSRSYAEFGARRSSRRSMTRSSSSSSHAGAFLAQWNASASANAVSASTQEGQTFVDDDGVCYTVGRQIGFGGFSTVHEASVSDSRHTKELFAVKIVRVQPSSQGEQEIQRERSKWEYEVSLWSKLKHPHILRLESVSSADGIMFCVMRRASCSLMDLAQRHRSERGLTLHLAKRYIYQLASALRYLHKDMKIVHRDIKLENCLICYDEPLTAPTNGIPTQPVGTLLLCDFGLADYVNPALRGMPDISAALEQEDILPKLFVAGSLPYAAPDLLRDPTNDLHEGVYDPAIDIWALGVVSYTLLTGRIPFSHAIEGALVNEILKGQWNRDLLQAVVKVKAKPADAMFEVVHALDLLHGVLDMHSGSRWGAPQVMSCRFLTEVREAANA